MSDCARHRSLLSPAKTRETGNGWGLALALVKQIADYHQGPVHCLPRAGGGCVFELVLPAAARR